MSRASIITALEKHQYHKLIIGAALKDHKAIENYSYLFTHAEANVIDISAFPHSVISAKVGIQKAIKENPQLEKPTIMVSVNIGKDPHFRRIEVDFDNCTNCLLCVPSCPSDAFSIKEQKLKYDIDLCFACSNCLDDCSFDALHYNDWSAYRPETFGELAELGAGAFEIHLNNDLDAFKNFYRSLDKLPEDFIQSFSIGSEMMNKKELLEASSTIIKEVYDAYGPSKEIILQVDGIPISGAKDLKQEKDMVSIESAKLVLEHLFDQAPANPVYLQLAGGIDEKSLAKAFLSSAPVNGVAIGSSARKKLQETLDISERALEHGQKHLEQWESAKKIAKDIIKNSKNRLQDYKLEVECN